MRRKLLTTVIALVSFLNIYAGGLLTNTNQNVTFLRNISRDASMEIDATYTNPAGLAFLSKDGFFLSLNSQSAFQTRNTIADFAPFAGFGGNAVKKFEGKATVWSAPNLQAAYKIGDWVFSVNLGVAGGGGDLNFNEGLSSFESTVAIVPVLLNTTQPALNFGGYDLESRLKGSSVIYNAQVGATYKIVDHFSAYAGIRYYYVDNEYKGYLKNARLGMNGNLVPAISIVPDPLKPLVNDKELNCKQTGSGITPIIGLDYNWNKLNIGAKYEFKTGINLKNKSSVNTTGITDYYDGKKTPYDIPALLAVGAQYDIIPKLTVSASYHHFFDSDAKMVNDKQKFINGGINEYLAGVEYRINNLFLVSCGAQLTRTGVTDDYQTDMNFSLNSYSVGFGGAINITKNIRVNLAYFFTNYENWTKNVTDYGKINNLTQGMIPATPGMDTFTRTNKSCGIGLDFRF